MKICMKLEHLAILQKLMAWAIVIIAARSNMHIAIVIVGCLFGIFLNEVADVWYKFIPSRRTVFEIKKSA